MGNLLRVPRVNYSTNFTDIFSSDRQVQYHYVNGLLAVMVSFIVILIFWVFVLFVLKFKGQEVGCASGQAFLTKHDGEDVASTDDDEASFSSFGSRSASQQNSVSKLIKQKDSLENFLSLDTEGEDGPPTDPMTRVEDSRSFDNDAGLDPPLPDINPRESRTRFCFLFFSLLALICVPTILVTSFGPLKDAVQTSNELVAVSQSSPNALLYTRMKLILQRLFFSDCERNVAAS